MEQTNKHIVITGGTSGVGKELVRLLAPSHPLTVIGRHSERSTALLTEFPEIAFVEADLAAPEATRQVRAAIPPGPLHGLINCAAIQCTPKLTDEDFDLRTIRKETSLNFVAPAELTALFLPDLLQAERPFILNVNSGLAIAPKAESAVYCATKAALDSFSRSLQAQLSHTQIAVLQAFLPIVDTPMTADRTEPKLGAVEVARQIIRGIELRRPYTDIGKVKLLRKIDRWAPDLARRIMLKSG